MPMWRHCNVVVHEPLCPYYKTDTIYVYWKTIFEVVFKVFCIDWFWHEDYIGVKKLWYGIPFVLLYASIKHFHLNLVTIYVPPSQKINIYIRRIPLNHYGDVIMSTMASQNTSLSIVCSSVCSGAGDIWAPRHWPLWGEFTGDRWIPRTKGQ